MLNLCSREFTVFRMVRGLVKLYFERESNGFVCVVDTNTMMIGLLSVASGGDVSQECHQELLKCKSE